MGVLGEMFPGRKLRSEAGESGSGERWRLGPIDLDAGVVEVHRAEPEPEPDPEQADDEQADDERPAGPDGPPTPLPPG